jgi:hypothetical protein
VIFLESQARWLLVLHGVLGAAVVATTTHLAVWSWRLRRGEKRRARGAVWLATVGASLCLVQFVAGNLLYPVYKVRVRAEYFDSPPAVAADAQARRARSLGGAAPAAPPPRLEATSRLFDVKEHAVALGLALAVAAAFLARHAREGTGDLLLWCALGSAACAWAGGVIGLWVTSFRSVGGL